LALRATRSWPSFLIACTSLAMFSALYLFSRLSTFIRSRPQDKDGHSIPRGPVGLPILGELPSAGWRPRCVWGGALRCPIPSFTFSVPRPLVPLVALRTLLTYPPLGLLPPSRIIPLPHVVPRADPGLLGKEVRPAVLHVARKSAVRRDLRPRHREGPARHERRRLLFAEGDVHQKSDGVCRPGDHRDSVQRPMVRSSSSFSDAPSMHPV
jgi:hypothetical protein